MVIFNDPVPVENPALQAVLMALELREALGALTATWSRLGHEIGFGIGIAHGFATLGTIGPLAIRHRRKRRLRETELSAGISPLARHGRPGQGRAN